MQGLPTDLLAPLAGETITIAGFETALDWFAAFKKEDILMKTISLPRENLTKSPWEGALIAMWPKVRAMPTRDEMARGQRLVALKLTDPSANLKNEDFFPSAILLPQN
jgi:hypothetical protein